MQPARVGGRISAEPLGAEPERLRAEMRELGLDGLGREAPRRRRASSGRASVSTSSPPPSNRRRNAGVFGPFSPGRRYFSRPADIRWITRTSSPSSVGNSSRLPRRSTPEKRLPSSADSGGSNVFSVATCAGPAFSIGNAARGRRGRAATPPSRVAQARTLLHMDPFRVTVSRGSVTEGIHRVHAVAVQDGRIVDSAGDAHLLTFYRSSSKPLQALPLARERARRDRRRAGDRLGIAPSPAGAARSRGEPPGEGARDRGRPRVRPPGRPRARHRSRTTAPASTPASSPSAMRAAGRPRATGSPTTRCSSSSIARSPTPRS